MAPYFYFLVCSILCINQMQAMEWPVLGFTSDDFRQRTGEMIKSIGEKSKRGLVKSYGKEHAGQEGGISQLLKKFIIRL